MYYSSREVNRGGMVNDFGLNCAHYAVKSLNLCEAMLEINITGLEVRS